MKKKTFDCVEMKRRGAARIFERTKNMTLAQKIDYWHQRSKSFQSEQGRLNSEAKTVEGA